MRGNGKPLFGPIAPLKEGGKPAQLRKRSGEIDMTAPVTIAFEPIDLATLPKATGQIVLIVDAVVAGTGLPDSAAAHALNTAMGGALARALASDRYGRLKVGDGIDLAFPSGLAADALSIIRLPHNASLVDARHAGGYIGRVLAAAGALVLAETHPLAAEVAHGIALRAYDFSAHKTSAPQVFGRVVMAAQDPEALARQSAPLAALAEGVLFTRDLVNEPANILTTDDFAARLAAMQELGIEVEILDEPQLEKLGMRALLGVGQGSASASKVVVMQWRGGAGDLPAGSAPLALVGKGVVFDTGGISIKPAAGMEEMTMDMGGAAVVAGVMRTLALRRARTHVVGLVGLVENMPDGLAQRPGDVVRSMKGDTIEVINTDAEGRLVLADVLWYAQDRFKPRAMIDLATLTGAIIVALGHENAGVFTNNDELQQNLLTAARSQGEGAWPMPMGAGYDAKLKSRVADMVNSCGRDGGSVTAAQFLRRFVREDVPWCHIDIAGVASQKAGGALAPKGATGWGVATLNRLIADKFEAH
jgi:leucyl aminopeptidase